MLQPLPYERKKRGLFNIGGSLANFLFGITTDTALSSKLDVQNQKIASVVKSFSTALDTFTDINAKLNTLRTTANTISSSIFTMANQTNKLKQFSLITVSLTLFSNQVHHLVDDLRTLTENLVLASHGEVVPSLLSHKELTRILYLFTAGSNRQTLFPMTASYLYYPYMTAILYPNVLHILIPLKPIVTFQAFRIHPFPSMHNGSILVATMDKNIVLRSANGKSVSALAETDYEKCKRAIPLMAICFDLILPETPYLASSCARSLMVNINVNNDCMFDEIALKSPFHTSFANLHFLFFPSETLIVITCNDTHKDEMILGSYVLPTHCSLHSNTISLKAHHILYTSSLPSKDIKQNNISLEYQHMIIPQTNIRFLSNHTNSHFFFPSNHMTYGIPSMFSFTPFALIAIVISAFYLHKYLKKNVDKTNDDIETDTSNIETEIPMSALPVHM